MAFARTSQRNLAGREIPWRGWCTVGLKKMRLKHSRSARLGRTSSRSTGRRKALRRRARQQSRLRTQQCPRPGSRQFSARRKTFSFASKRDAATEIVVPRTTRSRPSPQAVDVERAHSPAAPSSGESQRQETAEHREPCEWSSRHVGHGRPALQERLRAQAHVRPLANRDRRLEDAADPARHDRTGDDSAIACRYRRR